MQPVWRGERTKRGRYKEFWQFDVDTIWRSETDVGVWYDAESIIVTYQALAEIFATFGIQRKIAVHISNIAVTKSYLTSLGIIGDVQKNVCKLLDDYYKVPHEVFVEKLSAHADAPAVAAIAALVQSRDHNDPAVRACEAWGQLDEVLGYLQEFDVPVTYDLAIMRGHGYYTGTVVEIFLTDDMALGAISGGGAYRNMTDFIDPKHSFSGVGCSISSRIMELVMEMEGTLGKRGESYMFLHFRETRTETLALMQHFQASGKSCQLYACDAKFGKQLQYADNVGCTHAVILGTDELARGEFLVKNLASGEMLTGKMDAAYGVIPICEIDGEKKILLMLGKPSGHW